MPERWGSSSISAATTPSTSTKGSTPTAKPVSYTHLFLHFLHPAQSAAVFTGSGGNDGAGRTGNRETDVYKRQNHDRMRSFAVGVLPFVLVLGVVAALMLLEPHLSGTLLILSLIHI